MNIGNIIKCINADEYTVSKIEIGLLYEIIHITQNWTNGDSILHIIPYGHINKRLTPKDGFYASRFELYYVEELDIEINSNEIIFI